MEVQGDVAGLPVGGGELRFDRRVLRPVADPAVDVPQQAGQGVTAGGDQGDGAEQRGFSGAVLGQEECPLPGLACGFERQLQLLEGAQVLDSNPTEEHASAYQGRRLT